MNFLHNTVNIHHATTIKAKNTTKHRQHMKTTGCSTQTSIASFSENRPPPSPPPRAPPPRWPPNTTEAARSARSLFCSHPSFNSVVLSHQLRQVAAGEAKREPACGALRVSYDWWMFRPFQPIDTTHHYAALEYNQPTTRPTNQWTCP